MARPGSVRCASGKARISLSTPARPDWVAMRASAKGRAAAVIRAGSDVALHCSGDLAEMEAVAAKLTDAGQRPYVIPGGGSNPLGAVGYVNAALELVNQSAERGLRIDHLVHATGSAGTQAGLVVGLHALNSPVRLLGIGVRAPREKQEAMVHDLGCRTWDFLGLRGELPREKVAANCDYVGGGYGVPTPGMVEAVRLLAQTEGLLLDPVYSGKGMAGLIDLIRKGRFKQDENVVFLHTGGSVGLFGYPATFAPAVA